MAIGTVTSQRIPTKLTLTAKEKGHGKPYMLGNRDVRLTATLTAEGQPLEGKTIEFTTDSTLLCTETTDSRGKATCNVPGKQHKETCYTATFAGDDTYEPSTATLCRNGDHGKHHPWLALHTQSGVSAPALLSAMP
ncbi:Ig-like domain-containing protein [Streptomyces sp. NBC_01619]|uniref:Ig-like domain-containing protein n=1 Tax=Streptomyces sp. NBC_01619 TaxID=2975901 RepID=UPI002253D704|nr:Ig-like domain-containing protein [Streptomyces sp. NBC_01619]MCX4515893.1 Ig-like domain-containing protein [Streptomyces sp. NBC_01619]